jgi:hypothetical protein
MYIFETSMKIRTFLYPIQPIKSFHLIVESMCTFYELKMPKLKQPLNIFGKWFSINRSEVFMALPKFYATYLDVKINGVPILYIQQVPNNIKTLNVLQNNLSKIFTLSIVEEAN